MALSRACFSVEDADAGGAEHLVAGEGVEIGVERLQVHLHVGGGLGAVDQRQGRGLVCAIWMIWLTGLMVPSAFETWVTATIWCAD